MPSCKVPVILTRYKYNFKLSYIFKKSPNIKFNENLYSGSQVDAHGGTDMTNLTAAIHNIAVVTS
jgi:hypothetical protein